MQTLNLVRQDSYLSTITIRHFAFLLENIPQLNYHLKSFGIYYS